MSSPNARTYQINILTDNGEIITVLRTSCHRFVSVIKMDYNRPLSFSAADVRTRFWTSEVQLSYINKSNDKHINHTTNNMNRPIKQHSKRRPTSGL